VRAEKSTEVRQSAGHIDRHASYMRLRCVAGCEAQFVGVGGDRATSTLAVGVRNGCIMTSLDMINRVSGP
jgi:hypothetical protein